MKTIYFDDDITIESVRELITIIEESNSNKFTIYFTSNGGTIPSADVLINFINKNPKKYTFISSWFISSAAFLIMYKIKCKKKILDNTHAIIHLYSSTLEYRLQKDAHSMEYYLTKNLKKSNKKFIKFLKKINISKKNIEKIEKGKDVILNTKELRQILEV